MSYSLLFEGKKNELKAYRAAEETVSRALSVSAIRDGVKHGQMHFIHSLSGEKKAEFDFIIVIFKAFNVLLFKKIKIIIIITMFISSNAFAQKLTKIKNNLLIMSKQERFGVVSKQKEIYIGICIDYIIKQGHIKHTSDSKDIFNVTNNFYFKQMLFF